MIPSAPSVTARTAAVFVTIVKTTSLRSATSRGVSAQRAPASSSGSAFSRVRFHTVTSWPAASSRRTIALPITPSPTYPTSAIRASSRRGRPRGECVVDIRLDADEVRAHRFPRRRRIAGGDRRADRPVLLQRALRALRDQEDRHQRAPDHAAYRIHRVEDDAVARRLGDREMEAQIAVDVARPAIRIRRSRAPRPSRRSRRPSARGARRLCRSAARPAASHSRIRRSS